MPPAQKEVLPRPDPSVLTTENLRHENTALRELLETRISGLEKEISIFNETITRVLTDVTNQIMHLKALHEEKFRAVQTQFGERDTRTDKTAEMSQKAIDAALQAAKEAVGAQNASSALAIAKSESATQKQIDAQAALIGTATAAIESKISDMKERITENGGRSQGRSDVVGWIVAAISLAACVVLAVMAVKR
jgi:uncharacterized coiled-coil protein SlyX